MCFFSIPIWLMWSCSNDCCCSDAGITILLSINAIPSVTARSSQKVQYSWFLVFPLFWLLAICLCILSGIVSTHYHELHLIYLGLCLNSQPVMYSSRPGWYGLHMFYWYRCSTMHCNHCHDIATCFWRYLPVVCDL